MIIVIEILALLTSITNLILGFLVWHRNKTNRINVTLAFFAFSTGLWIFSNFLLRLSTDHYLLRLTFSLGALVATTAIIWTTFFTERARGFSGKLIIWLTTTLGLFFVLLPFFGDSVVKGHLLSTDPFASFEKGVMFNYYALYAASAVFVPIILLLTSYNKTSHLKKMQYKLVLLGITLFGISTMTVSLILPLFGIEQFSSFDSFSSLFFVGFAAYAIIKYRFMDIRLVVARSVAYTLLLIIIGGFFVFTISYLEQFSRSFMGQSVAFVIAGLVAAFGFQPLRRFLQRATDRIFAKGRYDPEKLLAKLGDLLSSKLELNELTESVLKTLTREMRITRAAFVLTSDTDISDIKSFGYDKEIPTKPAWSAAARMALTRRKLTVADELEEGSTERELMRTLSVEVLVPLPTEDKFVGLLALGEKRSGDMYTSQDLRLLEIIAPEAAIAVQNAMLFKEKEKRIQELDSLYNLALSLGSTLRLDELLEQVIDEAISVTGAETGSIMLVDEESQTLSIKVSRGIHPEIHRSIRTKIGEGIAGWVAKTSHPLVLINGQDPRFQEHLKRDEITSALTVPLKVREKVIGVLSVNRKDSKEIFTQDNLRIITSFAAQAAEAIENARLYENLEHTFLGTISALAAAVDAKDHYTYGHSEMVTDLAVETARELMLSKEEIRKIEIASKLHDIGKIGIDGSILNKPGKLTEEERKLIEEHPKIAVDILKSVAPLKEIIPLILYHHERFDGKGYPVGLSGNAIPLGARILATADSFNAMVSDRPYRAALDLFTATRELQNCSGTQFDPQVVDAFLRVLEKKYTRQSEPLMSRAK
jgi:HD-GYP domain-containing protein (c-di-GMP phosphodiesterase class II)